MGSNQTSVLRPKFIALDSSHLAVLIQDKNSSDTARKQSAQAFENAFNERGCVVLLTLHHLEELLRHRDEAVVAQQMSYIRALPMVAWIAASSDPRTPGSVADIFSSEAATLFNSPELSLRELRDHVAKSLFQIGTGQDAIAPFQREWRYLQEHFQKREARQRELVSISKSEFTSISKTKVKDWLKGRLRSPEDSANRLHLLTQELAKDIRSRGDKRVPDARRAATMFLDDTKRSAAQWLSRPEEPALQILLAQDIDLSDIDDDTTMADIGDLATFRRKLRIINATLDLSWPDLRARVGEDRVPTGVIQASLRKHGQDLPERKGSDLSDMYLACLAAYADITYVDKRTYENVRRARQKCSVFAAIIQRVEKASDYREIATHLDE